jgi:hypothetical protein
MRKRFLASRVIAIVGVLLLVVAAIHLIITPLLKEAVLDRVLAPEMLPIVAPPFVLNHVVVGILLIPLGAATLYCSAGIRTGQRWAWVICLFIGLALLCLPAALLLIMRGGMFQALPFRVAEVLVTISAATMPTVLWWVLSEFVRRGATRGMESADGG